MKSVGVIGGGSWGTALVSLLSNNNSKTIWCVRSEQTINNIIEDISNKRCCSSKKSYPF